MSQSNAKQQGLVAESETTQSDGSQVYSYTMNSGSTFESLVPPAGFLPLTASNAQLDEYGFPSRPSGPALSSWTQAMEAWTGDPVPNMTFIEGSPEAAPPAGQNGQVPANDSAPPSEGQTDTNNWSGWLTTATNDDTWIAAEGTFATPNVGAQCGNSSRMAIWTGMGGYYDYKNNALLQSGIFFNNNIPGQVTLWTPFWEEYSSNDNEGPYELYGANNVALAINPGNTLFSSTSYNESSGQVQFYLEDETTGKTADLITSGSSHWNGSSSDWIVEFPLGTVGAQFQQFAIIDAYGASAGGVWHTIASVGNLEVQIVNGGILDANPGPLGSSGNDFAEGFDNCI